MLPGRGDQGGHRELGPVHPLAPAAGLVIAVAALVAGAVMVPFYVMSRREPALAAG
jgi:hypothetical protein